MGRGTTYGQFCPISRASEIVAQPWTPLILRELLLGHSRFGEIHAGVPRMSPSLLSRRLRGLAREGVVERRRDAEGRPEYVLTEAGRELHHVVVALGQWGQRWMGDISTDELDATLLMKDMKRRIDRAELPERQVTLGFHFPDARPGQREWWIVLTPHDVDVCDTDPGFDVDLWVGATLHTLTRIWMGELRLEDARIDGQLSLLGPRSLQRQFTRWLALSDFAAIPRAVTAKP